MLWLSFESVIIYKEKGEQNNTNSHNCEFKKLKLNMSKKKNVKSSIDDLEMEFIEEKMK